MTADTAMGAQARKHHYIPQCYLKGFARNRSKNSQLYVVDAKTKRAFLTTPQNVAAERDFNRIDVEGEDPNVVESGYATFESKLAPALVRLDAQGTLQDEQDRALVLELIALMAVRNPLRREASRRFHEDVTRRMMDLVVADKRRFESQVRRATEAGFVKQNGVSYEEFRDFVREGRYAIEVSTTGHVQTELQSLTTVYDLLHRRSWVLIKAAPDTGGFVASDHPVTLCWDDPKMEGGIYPPGFGLSGTTVICPLTKHWAIQGRLDGRAGSIEIPAHGVAALNTRTIGYAGRQIYAESDRFRFIDGDGMLRHGSELLSAMGTLAAPPT
ncbi:DUF4238 domain-containing protein [Cupriavidus basilensis]|uniref:DUF4238 domain-containing protein n=1 Tax=Cupriavidus basilensis TaxID=68895 RepID=A0A643FVQ9_9BURK|nr:DUF4238 domain-containing protein [Cupriavidus basilensis]QOT82219.1 DUF4238 domain-containing protein [Cupriavidus basilensis]